MKTKLLLLIFCVFCVFLGTCSTNAQELSSFGGNPHPVFSGVNGKLGFIENNGRLIIPFNLPIEPENLYTLTQEHSFSDGRVLIKSIEGYEEFEFLNKTYRTPIYKYGYSNNLGEIIIKPAFDYARPFSEGLAYVEKGEEQYYINLKGDIVIASQNGCSTPFSGKFFETKTCDFSEGLALSGKDFINKEGKIVIEGSKFEELKPFREGLAAVLLNDRWGFIDKTGKLVIPAIYKDVNNFSENLAAVSVGKDRLGFVNSSGKLVISTKFSFFDHNGKFTPYRRWVKGSYYVDDPNKPFNLKEVDVNYSTAPRFSEGMYPVTFDGKKWGFINKKGLIVISPKFDSVGNFVDGIAKVRVSQDYYFINKAGKNIFGRKYKYVSDFSNGLAMVFYKWDYRFDNIQLPPIFEADPESCGDGASKDLIIYGYINKRGKRVFLDKYEYLECFESQGSGGPAMFELPHSADVEIKSNPNGAKIYLIPFTVWDFDDNLINNQDKLENYRQPTDTNSVLNVLE